jgi:hypothetical protein
MCDLYLTIYIYMFLYVYVSYLSNVVANHGLLQDAAIN